MSNPTRLPLIEPDHRHLIVAPHVDDDGVGFGVGIRDLPNVSIVYLTDGVPRDPRYFTAPGWSRESYAAARYEEALQAATLMRVPHHRLQFLAAPDMETFREIARLEQGLGEIASTLSPTAIWSPSYDGGHPDHDVAAFLATRLSLRLQLPHFEFALYRYCGGFRPQEFADGDPGTARVLTPAETLFKRELLAVYASQASFLNHFDVGHERYRPARHHDFSRPPGDGPTLYESWRWPVTAAMLIEAFAATI